MAPPVDVSLLNSATFEIEYEATGCNNNCETFIFMDIKIVAASTADFDLSDTDLDAALSGGSAVFDTRVMNDATKGTLYTHTANLSSFSSIRLTFYTNGGCFHITDPPVLVTNVCPGKSDNVVLPKTYSKLSDSIVMNGTCAAGYETDPLNVRRGKRTGWNKRRGRVKRLIERETNKQTAREIDRQTDRKRQEADGQADSHRERERERMKRAGEGRDR